MIGQPASIHTTAKYERDRKKKGGKKYSVNNFFLNLTLWLGDLIHVSRIHWSTR